MGHGTDGPPARMSVADLEAFLDAEFPQIHRGGRVFRVEAAGHGRARLRAAYDERLLRPGGTISGPTMMTLADLGLYCAILASIGPVALAVTTNLSFNFLRKPGPADLIGDCRLLKLGKRLAVGEVTILSEGVDAPVAHAVGTYAIPG